MLHFRPSPVAHRLILSHQPFVVIDKVVAVLEGQLHRKIQYVFDELAISGQVVAG